MISFLILVFEGCDGLRVDELDRNEAVVMLLRNPMKLVVLETGIGFLIISVLVAKPFSMKSASWLEGNDMVLWVARNQSMVKANLNCKSKISDLYIQCSRGLHFLCSGRRVCISTTGCANERCTWPPMKMKVATFSIMLPTHFCLRYLVNLIPIAVLDSVQPSVARPRNFCHLAAYERPVHVRILVHHHEVANFICRAVL